jgi:two-component system phosphate regulon sensor histidine kinase PhoR
MFFVWPLVTIFFLTCLALHFGWRAKLRRERAAWQAELSRRDAHEQATNAETVARQDALFDSMIEGVLVLDEDDCVRFANRAFAEMFATVGMLRGKALLEAVRFHEVADIVAQTRAEGRVVDHEMKLPGETERWLQINAAALTGVDRRKLGTILVFHDLTRIKQLEATRQEFVANVSHELRTPLAMIKGYTETLLGGAKDDPATATKFLQTVERHANRLTLLIEDLLTISSLESGQIQLRQETIALPGAVEKVFNDLKPRAEARSVKLLNQVPPLAASADANRLHQVLSNLVDNAIKYGRAEGEVIVSGRETGDGQIEISVRDDGPGIPAEALDRIFERFYRVDKARSRDQGGTGLGLSIVKHIVQAHGGKIWAASEVGAGTTFFFTLPRGQGGVLSELLK